MSCPSRGCGEKYGASGVKPLSENFFDAIPDEMRKGLTFPEGLYHCVCTCIFQASPGKLARIICFENELGEVKPLE